MKSRKPISYRQRKATSSNNNSGDGHPSCRKETCFTLKRRPLSQVANTTILFVKTISHTSNNVNASHEGENTQKQIKKANPH
jgi:hypothetical protein